MVAVQKPKHVATLLPNPAVVFSETAPAWNRTNRLPFNNSVFIITQELTTDQLHQTQFRVVTTDWNLS